MAASAYSYELTVNEAAHLAGVSVGKVEKSCQEGIVRKKKHKGHLIKREVFHVSAETIIYTAALKNCSNIFRTRPSKRVFGGSFENLVSLKTPLGRLTWAKACCSIVTSWLAGNGPMPASAWLRGMNILPAILKFSVVSPSSKERGLLVVL